MNIPNKQARPERAALPILENGDHMSQAEFHRRYEAYPEDTKFELIGGVVYMASPQRIDHGEIQGTFSMVLRSTSSRPPECICWAAPRRY